MAYGLGDVVADVYEGYQSGKKEQDESEARRMKLDQVKNQLEQEGFSKSMRLLLTGRTGEAESNWNNTGKSRIRDLDYDRESGKVSWFDEQANKPVVQDVRVLAKLSGIDLGEDIQAKREHELKLAGVRSGGAKGTTLAKNVGFLTRKGMPFAGRPEAALKYLNMAKSSPEGNLMRATKIVDDAGTYEDEIDRQKQIDDLVEAAGGARRGLYGLGGAPATPPPVAPAQGLATPGLATPEPVQITTAAQYNKLGSGQRYRDPKGNIRVKK